MTTPSQRSEIARMGAYAMYAKHDPKVVASRRMETRMRKYREAADPTGELAQRNPQDLAKRAEALMKADMARVRLAKAQRAVERNRLEEMTRYTPSNDLAQLGAIVEVWTANAQTALRLETSEAELRTIMDQHARTAKADAKAEAKTDKKSNRQTQRQASRKIGLNTEENEAASVSAEAAPQHQSLRNTRKNVSSDGSVASVSHTPRRRQTNQSSTPRKAASHYGQHSSSPLCD